MQPQQERGTLPSELRVCVGLEGLKASGLGKDMCSSVYQAPQPGTVSACRWLPVSSTEAAACPLLLLNPELPAQCCVLDCAGPTKPKPYPAPGPQSFLPLPHTACTGSTWRIHSLPGTSSLRFPTLSFQVQDPSGQEPDSFHTLGHKPSWMRSKLNSVLSFNVNLMRQIPFSSHSV